MLKAQKALLPEFHERLVKAVDAHGLTHVYTVIGRRVGTVARWLAGPAEINPPSADFDAILATLRVLTAVPKRLPAGTVRPRKWRGPKPMQRVRG